MEQLRIRLLGGLEIQRGGLPLPLFPTQKSEKLFAYLVLSGDRPIHREIVCDQLWGEETALDTRKALRTELWRIRSVLEPADEDRGRYLRVEADLVGLANPGACWVDIVEFEAGVKIREPNGHTLASDAEQIEHALSLYRGDFLEGHYDGWSIQQQDRFRMLRLTAVERLVAIYRSISRWHEAIYWGRELLHEDPLREHIHRSVMASHLAMGDRPSAIRQYQACARALARELAIEPMQQTRRLYETIRDGGNPDLSHYDLGDLNGATGQTGGHRGFAAEVDSALKDLYALTERLERTRDSLRPEYGPLASARKR